MASPLRNARRFDLAVIGGGINGCGIAADAAGRGLDVLLVEQGDLAQGTSSASSKLIHGGLRYLEHYEFRLVRESFEEREVLLANAPHIVWPMRFVVPHVPGMRSRLLMRAGLFLYDNLASRRRMPASGALDLTRDPAGRPLNTGHRHGFHYADCWADDARLVVTVAKAAAERGAVVATRTALASARAEGRAWRLLLEDRGGGSTHEVAADVLVNAAGPWAGRVAANAIRRPGLSPAEIPVRLVKGSHIVLPRIAGADDAYLLQSADGRVVFLLPFARRFTLIGTTDVPFEGDPLTVAPSAGEEDYLLAVANGFLAAPLSRADIVWRFAGVRPLYDDRSANPSAVTRDYRLELDAPEGGPVLLTVVGGKLTTYRRLAEAVLGRVAPHFARGLGPAWTRGAVLPGGDIGNADFGAFARRVAAERPGIDREPLHVLLRRYGSRALDLLGDAQTLSDLGADLGGGITERELDYLVREEWAATATDVLWRRTKAGLGLDSADLARAERSMAEAIARLVR